MMAREEQDFFLSKKNFRSQQSPIQHDGTSTSLRFCLLFSTQDFLLVAISLLGEQPKPFRMHESPYGETLTTSPRTNLPPALPRSRVRTRRPAERYISQSHSGSQQLHQLGLR
jgi:hypothetical protein